MNFYSFEYIFAVLFAEHSAKFYRVVLCKWLIGDFLPAEKAGAA